MLGRWARLGSVCALTLAFGCKKDKACESLTVEVTVTDTNQTVISDAEVKLTSDANGTGAVDHPCPPNGDGTYTCSVPEAGEYALYVQPVIPVAPPFYESYGTTIVVEDPEDCEAPAATHEAILRFESGGA
jgi:hypothetical protein